MMHAVTLAYPRRPKPTKTRFRRNGEDELKTIVDLIRGSMIAAMDEAYLNGEFGRKLGRDHKDWQVREHAQDLFQELMLHLFPEEFGEPGDGLPPGVVPPAGPRRVGADRLIRYGELVGGLK